MINKKLLSFDRAALRYVGANVAFQWLGLMCNIIFVRAVARLVGAGSTGKESRPKSEKLLYFVGQRRKRSCTIYEDTSFFLWERRSILSKRERNRNRSFSWQDDRTFYLL